MVGNKIFWFDCETTGLDPIKNDILILSGMVEIDGEIKKGITLKMQPISYQNISDEALKINGLTLDQIKTFDDPHDAQRKLVSFFNEFVNKYDKHDKFLPAGYNVGFDVQFLFSLFEKCGDKYCGSYIDYHKLDVASIVLFFKLHGFFPFHGYKLQSVADALQVPINAHDAKEDIIATRKIYYKLMNKIQIKDEY